jgi:hypothetical protein
MTTPAKTAPVTNYDLSIWMITRPAQVGKEQLHQDPIYRLCVELREARWELQKARDLLSDEKRKSESYRKSAWRNANEARRLREQLRRGKS